MLGHGHRPATHIGAKAMLRCGNHDFNLHMQASPSPSSESCEVLVIGGGPAGSTVAALLATQGRKVVLVKKAQHPRF